MTKQFPYKCGCRMMPMTYEQWCKHLATDAHKTFMKYRFKK